METFSQKFTRFVLVAVILATLVGIQVAHASGTTRYVATTGTDSGDCSSSGSPCLTIAYAYTQAASGDTISVAAGTYTETSEYDITKNLTISGAGAMSTFVQAAASAGSATHRFYKVNSAGINVNIQNLTLRYGVQTSGGALNVAAGTLNLSNVILSDNQVKDISGVGLNGGALSVNGGVANLTNSAVINNSVTTTDTTSSVRGSGGGIFLGSTGTVTLNNTTVSGNSSIRGGGGLFTNGGTLNINYSTIANNTSNNADGITVYTSLDGGGINRNSGTINLQSSIVAGNKKGVSSSSDNDCNGTITSQGYNLTGSSTGCSIAGTGDVTVTASTVFTSVLGSLADNGGSTYTHALIVGGSAVNAIPSGTNSCGTSPFDYDQRGGTRPYSSSCDMGAYELKTVEGVSTTGTDSGDCTVTDCASITYAYGKAQAGNTINVAAGTYTETSEYDITKNITISGAGAMSTFVQAAASAGIATHRFYKVNSAGISVNIQNLTLRYGVQTSGGALNVAIGTLNLTNVILSDNQVKDISGVGFNGGALSVNGGTANLTNSAVINNSVTTTDTTSSVRGSGGGIFLGSTGTVTLNNTTVSGNSSIRGGGGLFTNGGTFNVNYSTVANNTSNNADVAASTSVDGGGINRSSTGVINLKSSIVAGNKKGLSSPSDNDCSGTITSQGYNLTGTSTGCSISGTGDVTVTASSVFTSVLGALANNGGSTYSHLLYGGNSAQDAIPNGTNSCGSGTFATDQLGSTRPYNINCDMGAYESQDAKPTVSMSSTASNPTNVSPIPVTVTFSESVTGFTSGDITPGNATVSNFTGSGASYSFDLIPLSDGTVTADIAAGVAQDSVYNYNTAATQLSRSYDGTPPAAPVVSSPVNGSSITDTTPTVSGTAEANSTMSVYFDSSLDGTTTTDSGGSWSYTPSSALTANTSHNVKVKASDAAGNTSVYSNTNTFTIDTSAPTILSIARFFPASTTTNASSVNFFIAFSESSLSGVNASDFTLTTTGSISGASISNVAYSNGASATVTVNTGSGDGTIRLDVTDDDSISDSAGNLLGGTGTGNGDYTSGQTFTIDKTAPTVSMSSSASNPTNLSPISVTVSFSESVSGFTSGDITPGNAAVSNFTGSGASYSFDLTPSGQGTVTADIAGAAAQDSANNDSSAASQFSIAYDSVAPDITINNPDTSTAMSKTITASASDGTLTMSNTTGSTCDGTLTFTTYASQTFLSVLDNGTKVCYKAQDTAGNVAYSLSDAIAGIAVATMTPTVTSTTTPTETATPSPTIINTPTSTATSTGTATATATMTPTVTPTSTASTITLTLTSIAAQDGWVLESSETSGVGGQINSKATTFNLGDDATKKQYRGVLSFNASSIPDTATITSVTLKIKQNAIVGGGNPVAAFKGFMVDIKTGLFGTIALQTSDFSAAASKSYGPFKTALASGWYSISLTAGRAFINKLSTSSGLTQIRLRFKLDDNNNAVANYLSLFSGNAPAASRPQLVITYTIP